MNTTTTAGSLTCINSRADIYGNRYFAFTYFDAETGKEARGTVCGGESNVRQIMFEMNGGSWEPRSISFAAYELPIREFNRLTKGWPHAGCTGVELVASIRSQIGGGK